MGLADLAALAVLAWFGSRLAVSAKRSLEAPARRHTAALLRGLRLRHFLPVPLVVAAVLITAVVLVQLPVLSFGWWTALGGEGNPVFGVTDATAGTPFELIIPAVFITLLLPALPLLVETEERIFRLGAERWSWLKRTWKALLFGLAHAVIGIPIGVAVALSIGGWYFSVAYLRAFRATGNPRLAWAESTRAHLAYNLTIIATVGGLLAAAVVVTAL